MLGCLVHITVCNFIDFLDFSVHCVCSDQQNWYMLSLMLYGSRGERLNAMFQVGDIGPCFVS